MRAFLTRVGITTITIIELNLANVTSTFYSFVRTGLKVGYLYRDRMDSILSTTSAYRRNRIAFGKPVLEMAGVDFNDDKLLNDHKQIPLWLRSQGYL